MKKAHLKRATTQDHISQKDHATTRQLLLFMIRVSGGSSGTPPSAMVETGEGAVKRCKVNRRGRTVSCIGLVNLSGFSSKRAAAVSRKMSVILLFLWGIMYLWRQRYSLVNRWCGDKAPAPAPPLPPPQVRALRPPLLPARLLPSGRRRASVSGSAHGLRFSSCSRRASKSGADSDVRSGVRGRGPGIGAAAWSLPPIW
jgi:hypothetical protein